MRVSTLLRCITFCSMIGSPALGAEYYVATDGSDSNAGTEAQPFASVERGQQEASAGDTVWVRGGTYAFSSGTVGVSFDKAGQNGNPIQYFAYPGEVPIFDLSAINPSGRVTGFDITTDYIHIRGMEITGVPQYQSGQDSWALRIRGSNNVIELMNVHHNDAPGIFITSGANNLILNCDSHHNYDEMEGGGSGDGFGCHSTDAGNVFRGCRGWSNSDDGYDFINSPGACTVENSWAWRNGWVPDTNTAAGNGAGFKAGGFGLDTSSFPATIPVHAVHKCVAWDNRSQGFYANHHPGRIDWLNNTAYNNSRNYDMLDDVGEGTHYLRNNIAFGTGGDLEQSTSDDSENNSWDGGVSLSEADFQSLSDAGADGPRNADGSLPSLEFLRLAAGSDLIDAGVDVGLDYNDSAPDLGAFETGDPPVSDGTTGMATTTGSTGTTGGMMGATGAGGMGTSGADNTGSDTGGLGTTSAAGTGSGTAGDAVTTSVAAATTTGVSPSGAVTSATGNAAGTGGSFASTTGLSMTQGSGADPGVPGDEGGCACSVPSGRGPWPAPLSLMGLLSMLALRRRPRRYSSNWWSRGVSNP